ncbi:DNA-directed RNA polymerase I subunit RPA12-like [Lineus longissimus]|uniref:DNA-directed RNA polymerase I subunit RPA12-like n=1 Tax=Lineus longissimus TaxID=88925 RepID=UPI002B4CA95B
MTTKKVVFDGDITFCPECGTIMPNPGLADVVTCSNCKFQLDVIEYDGVEIHSKVVFNKRKTQTSSALDDEEASKGPLVDRQCSKCGNEGMTFSTRQTRGADEGQTVFFTCPRCGFQESEFS